MNEAEVFNLKVLAVIFMVCGAAGVAQNALKLIDEWFKDSWPPEGFD